MPEDVVDPIIEFTAQGLGNRPAILEQRGIDVSEEARSRVTGCDDPEVLRTWLLRAVTAATTDEVFDSPE